MRGHSGLLQKPTNDLQRASGGHTHRWDSQPRTNGRRKPMKFLLILTLVGCALGTVSAGDNGEVCVIDGVTYNAGDEIPNKDPCATCTCVPGATDQQLCAVVGCAQPLCGACGVKTSPDVCCPFCTPECNINNVTYCEGDSVKTDNPCETCSCAPDLPGQKICLTTPCFSVTGCGGFPMVTPPGECCPKCPTCDVVGPGYQPGDKLPIGDPCTLSCFCDREGRTACAPVFQPCPLVDCPFGTKAVVESIPGQCCPNITCVPIDSCEVNGTEYAFGDPVLFDDPCRVGCFCRPPGLVVCAIVDCFNFECPDGQRLKNLPDQCCPICVPEYPDCSFRLCKRKKNALCTIPDAAGDCTCKVTSCKAAYYSMDERPPPARCTRRNKCAGLTGEPLEKCLKKWGNCVKKAFRAQHGKTRANLRKSAFFKTLEYPCGD